MTDDVWVLVDTETDGLVGPIHAVEIAAQRFRGFIPEGPPVRWFLDHGIQIPPEAFEVHGYTPEFLKRNGVPPAEAYRDFWEYVAEARVVAHYAGFDWNRVLVPESGRLGVTVRGQLGFCSWALSRRALAGHQTWKLDHLRDHYALKCSRAHSALGDVEAVSDLITRVIEPSISRYGFRSPAHFAAFSRLPLKVCRMITSGPAFADLETAIETAWEESLKLEKARRQHQAAEERIVRRIEQCEESELQNLAVELGFYGDEPEIQFDDRSFAFTGTLVGAKRKEAQAATALRGALEPKGWPPDYLVLGGAAPGGGSLRAAIIDRQRGAEKPVLVSEEDFMQALRVVAVFRSDGSIDEEASRLQFTPHKPNVRTSYYLSGKIAWRAKIVRRDSRG